MEDDEINALAVRLETTMPPESAVVKIIQHGGGPDESHVVANRAGYLRLAALFLRAASAPLENEKSGVIDMDSSSMTDEDSDVAFGWLERRENLEKTGVECASSLGKKLFAVGCIALLAAAFALLLIGVGTVFSWL